MMVKTKYGCNVSVSITLDAENDIKRVIIHAPLYMKKEWSPTFCYSSQFSDSEIMEDGKLNSLLLSAYGIL